jgi:hypothetical protein
MLLALASASSQAAGFDGKTSLLCTATEVYECDAANTCALLPGPDLQDIRHLKVDMTQKTVTLAHVETGLSSHIDRLDTVDGKLIMQGIEDGRPDEIDGGGWTMSIDQTYGTMVFTQAGGSAAFVGFGGCVPAK